MLKTEVGFLSRSFLLISRRTRRLTSSCLSIPRNCKVNTHLCFYFPLVSMKYDSVILLSVEFCALPLFISMYSFSPISPSLIFLIANYQTIANYSPACTYEDPICAAWRVSSFYRYFLLIESIIDIIHLCIFIAKIKPYSPLWK